MDDTGAVPQSKSENTSNFSTLKHFIICDYNCVGCYNVHFIRNNILIESDVDLPNIIIVNLFFGWTKSQFKNGDKN